MNNLIKENAKNNALVNFDATEKLIKKIDLKAEELKQEILNSETRIEVKGKTYYVSENGDDNNNGLSPETAWKSIDKVNEADLEEGDAVLFERGGFFRGTVICKSDITYSAYGKGKKPIITSSFENGGGSEKWSLVEGTNNIWLYHKKVPSIGLMVFNHGENYSVMKMPSYVDGRFVVRHDRDTLFDVKKHMHCDLAHFTDLKDLAENGLPFVSADHVAPLYLRCDKGNPGELFSSIEFCTRTHGFLVGGCRNVKIDNIQVSYVGGHGVAAGTCRGLTITNCHFSWIGGSIQGFRSGNDPRFGECYRFGNAIEIYGGCRNYTCDHNYISQVFDAGITHQYSSGGERDCKQQNIKYTNNLLEYCTYSIEYFLGEAEGPNSVRFQRNILIENNIMRYIGFGFGEQRPEYDSPGAHIKSWDAQNPLDENFIVKNNIFDRSRHMMIHVAAAQRHWVPTFDGNIFIQYLNEGNSSLGRYGQIPTTVKPFSENVREIMDEIGLDENAGIYFAKRDALWDLPDFMPIKD